MRLFCKRVRKIFKPKKKELKKLIPNQIPADDWKGGFLESNPEMKYPNPNLSGLEFTDNLDFIPKITRQMRILWPEFTWKAHKDNEEDPKRCFQMFAPDLSRIGYDDTGQSWSVICPQQGAYIPGVGTFNLEITVIGQKGWVDESSKSLAIDLVVKPKIWLSRNAHQSIYGRLLWDLFKLNGLGMNFPSEKSKAIQVNTFRTDKEETRTISMRDGLFLGDKIPAFTDHSKESWTHVNVSVEVGDIDPSPHKIVTGFNHLIMDAFNLVSGNMLQKGNILSWNIWCDAPSKVDQEEWNHHAEIWRHSIDVDHCSPTEGESVPRLANGEKFEPKKEIKKEIHDKIHAFLTHHK